MTPKAMTLNKTEGWLQITWSDEQVCIYPLPQLREACPCVECRGGHQNMGREHEPKNILDMTLELKPARSYGVKGLEMIGNYAIQPVWEDGHHTGLYTWDYLRRLCPTPTADAELSRDGARNGL